MSYDISLIDPVTKEVLELDALHQMKGGTHALGGTKEAWLNITYNYSPWYYKSEVFPVADDGKSKGIRAIYGMTGAESIPVLRNAITVLEHITEDISDDERKEYEKQGVAGYWIPTRINAIRPLYSLLAFAQMRPDGLWEGD